MKRLARAVPLLVGAAAVVAFLPALRAGFVNWDDEASFLANPFFRGLGLRQLRWMATTTLLGHWSPLAWLTWSLNHALGGLDPWGYHLGNLLLHAATTALFCMVAARLIAAAAGAPADTPAVLAGAAVAALVFGVHPLRAESVAWVSERRDVLAGLFALGAVLAYLRGVRGGGLVERGWRAASLGAFALALSSKAIAMTLPLWLLLIDLYPLGRGRLGARALLREKAPWAVLGAAAGTVAFLAREESGNITGYDRYPAAARIALFAHSLWFYPEKLVWPAGLTPMYELPARVDPRQWRFLGAVLAVSAVTGLLMVLSRRWPAGLAAWAYSAVVLAPVAGVVHSGNQLASDRYSYLSGWGFALVAGGAVTWALRPGPGARWRRPAVAVAAAAVVAVLGARAWAQTGIWHSSQTLWRAAVAVDPDCSVCQSNLGRALLAAGQIDEAERRVRLARALRPERPGPIENLGVIMLARGRYGEAEIFFRSVVSRRPDSASYRNDLGVALASQERYAEAEAEFREAERLSPTLPDAPANLGALYTRQGRHAEAIEPLRRALGLDPSRARTRQALGRALERLSAERRAQGRADEAARLSGEAAALGVRPRP